MVAEMLDALTTRTAKQCRALLIDIFNHAAPKGLCPDNPAASTINRIEKKQRKRHTTQGLKVIREKSPAWLQNVTDLALITAQRHTSHEAKSGINPVIGVRTYLTSSAR